MTRLGLFIAAAASVLLLAGTITTGHRSAEKDWDTVANLVDSRDLSAWHPPVPGWHSSDSVQPELPEGHPPLSDLVVCPVTGAMGKSERPKRPRTAVKELVRI